MRVKHILLKHRYEAEDVIKLLNDGADFCKLAARFSICSSAKNCGDLGVFKSGRFVEEFEEGYHQLQSGQWSKVPLRTQFGFHILLKL